MVSYLTFERPRPRASGRAARRQRLLYLRPLPKFSLYHTVRQWYRHPRYMCRSSTCTALVALVAGSVCVGRMVHPA